MQRQGLKSTYLSTRTNLIKCFKLSDNTTPLLAHRCCYSQLFLIIMKLAEQHIYLMFDIQNSLFQKIGEVKILINKHRDMEKWKNPHLLKEEVIDYFRTERPEWKNSNIDAFYTGDLIPSL